MEMRVYLTEKGEETWEKVEEKGRTWAKETLGLTDFELDVLKVLQGCVKLKLGGVSKDQFPTFRKLEELGYCEIEEE